MDKLFGGTKLFLRKNSSTILTCIGAAGVVATSVMVVQATPKALALLESAEESKGEKLTKWETVKTAGVAYVPAMMVGAATVGCIFGANILNKKHQASMASSYALLSQSYKEYRNKVNELYGEDADKAVKQELTNDIFSAENGEEEKILFYDEFSERYFESTVYKVQRAQYELNRDLAMQDYALLNDYYRYLGIDPIESGDKLGWSTGLMFDAYWQNWIDFGTRTVTMDDGLECRIITIYTEPMLEWEDYC